MTPDEVLDAEFWEWWNSLTDYQKAIKAGA